MIILSTDDDGKSPRLMCMVLFKFLCDSVSLHSMNTEQLSCAAGWDQRAKGRLGAGSRSHVPQNS
jgi:hypothetical protein